LAIETKARDELAAIADIKVQQVVAWRRERIGDAALIASNTMMSPVQKVLAGAADEEARARVLSWMNALQNQFGYTNVILADLKGKVRLSAGRVSQSDVQHYARLVDRVARAGVVVFNDLHRDGGLSMPHLGLNIPLRFAPNGLPQGVLLMGIDPSDNLYPLVQTWPTPSRTGEVLLARREGDEVVYLNELRHRKDTALKLRIPVTQTNTPVVKAAFGLEGVDEGVDYRGVPVLAATRRVPGSPWVLVAKVDAEEIYSALRSEINWLLAIVFSLILAAGAVCGLVWRNLLASYYRQKYEVELERKKSEEERAKLQQQLVQAQKMESVGRLAGGVAHDFNNLLTVINGYAALSLAQLDRGHPLHTPISEIGKAGARAASLTQQLLALSRKQIIKPSSVDLNDVITDMGNILPSLLGDNVKVVIVPETPLGRVLVDPGQMKQVLMNLAVNAKHAMPGGGRLVIETGNAEIDSSYCANHEDIKPGSYVVMTVSDTGAGMAPETLRQIFEPFFTTKPEGHGTGLGLSTVYGIVKQSGGWIWAYSEAGKGASFKIYLPRLDVPVEDPIAVKPASGSLHGTECILVAEDQTDVRMLTAKILRGFGYQVLEASNGQEALLLAERTQIPIHLMVTDVVMPGMSGRELARQLLASRPATKVLYMSGYTANVIARQGVLDPGVAYLAKPFAPEALAGKVREVLGA
jgi:signal transduction histidine kinase/CheY-like chemotaxis protein